MCENQLYLDICHIYDDQHVSAPEQGLEQGKHELRLKLEGCQSQWESQVSELERDVRELRSEVERLTRALAESERDRSRDRQEHSEHSQRLGEMLTKVSPNFLPP